MTSLSESDIVRCEFCNAISADKTRVCEQHFEYLVQKILLYYFGIQRVIDSRKDITMNMVYLDTALMLCDINQSEALEKKLNDYHITVIDSMSKSNRTSVEHALQLPTIDSPKQVKENGQQGIFEREFLWQYFCYLSIMKETIEKRIKSIDLSN